MNAPSTITVTVHGALCVSPLSITGLVDGTHDLVVTATDLAGNVEPIPAVHTWFVDTSTPDTRIIEGPSGFVSSNTAEFSFQSPNAGAQGRFECAVDEDALSLCSSPYAVEQLGEGGHTFWVRAIDEFGNVDPTPAVRQWTVDTIAPQVLITAGPDGPTGEAEPTFSFEVSNEPSTVTCRFDEDEYVACVSPHLATPLPDGAHTFSVRAVDLAGNVAVATRVFSVDTIGPKVVIQKGPTGLIATATPTIVFASKEVDASFECAVDEGTFAGCVSPYTTMALAEGAHRVKVRASDSLGNIGPIEERSFVVDTIGPTVVILSGPGEGVLHRSASVTFSFRVKDANLASVQCRIFERGTKVPSFAQCRSPVTFRVGGGGSSFRTLVFQIQAQDRVAHTRLVTRTFQQAVPAT